MTDTMEPSISLNAPGQPERATEPAVVAPEPAAIPAAPVTSASPRSGDPSLPPRRARREGADVHRMVLGREIKLSGTISACDQLLVEGTIEADLTDCDDLQIAEMGLFKGSASIGEADIRGRFEGSLVVRNLIIRATAKVTGKIRYAQLQIERGGQLSGDVLAIDGGDAEV
jgi:cytoskeletal protein CcmA (bactofilin family)